MGWHKITHNDTGEVQMVASLDGIDLEQWTALPIVDDRCPEPDEQVDADGQIFTPLEWTRARKLAEVKDAQAMRFAMGWAHSFSVGDHVLDLRDADDKANWTLLLIKTNGMVAAGAGDVPVEIKTAFNEVIAVPAAEANGAMQAFLAWGEAMLKAKWALDRAVNDAADEAALALVDVAAGWPQ